MRVGPHPHALRLHSLSLARRGPQALPIQRPGSITDSPARRLSLRQRWRFFLNRLERWLLLRLHQLDVEAERLQLADEDVERLRQPGLERGVALDDRFV